MHRPLTVLPFVAFDADDGCFGASPAVLAEVLRLFEVHGPEYGLYLNHNKCEVITRTAGPLVELPRVTKSFGFESWSLLGAPCGGDAQRETVSASTALTISRKVRLLARVGTVDLQMAYVMLRACGAFPSAVFFLRAMGDMPAWGDVDKVLAEVVSGLFGTD